MKKMALAFLAVLLVVSFAPLAFAVKPQVNTIPAGQVYYSATHYLAGQAIPTGFDAYGYNYQGHMFSGSYFNSYAGGAGFPAWEGDDVAYLAANPTAASHWAWPYRDVQLMMKWNDAWISSVDFTGDHLLDRHYGYASYIGSGAWLTNHQSGTYEDNGAVYKWNYFTKIVAVPADAVLSAGVWYTAGGSEIGPSIWGEFATIQSIYNDQGTGDHGIEYLSPTSAGLGAY